MTAIERTKAIVLRRTNYGEADRILTLLTPLGQRNAIARGVRREKSRLAGGIELFAVSDVVLHRGKGSLYTMAGLGDVVSLQLVQVWFYLRYTELTGYELSLVNDVTGQPLDRQKRYMYDSIERGLRLSEQGELTADHIKFLRLAANKSLRLVAQIGGVEQILPGCWLLARQHAGV